MEFWSIIYTFDTIASAIAQGEVVVFAIPGAAMDEAIAAHAQALDGKIVVDTTNKLGAPAMNSAATVDAVAGLWFARVKNPGKGRPVAFKVLMS